MPIQPRPFGTDTLVIGIDVAKANHVAVSMTGDMVPSRPFAFENSRKGFEAFAGWLVAAAAKAGTPKVVVSLEPTGHYYKPLCEFLRARGIDYRIVSTWLTKRGKDMIDGSPLKTDAKDAQVIADLTRIGKSRPDYVHSEEIQELRYWVEYREKVSRDRTSCLNRLHRLLDLLFPEIEGMFSRIDCKSMLAVLETACTPGAVLELGVRRLTAVLDKASNGYYGISKASEIFEAAKTSIGCRKGITPLVAELLTLVPEIRRIDTLIEAIEQELAEILGRIDYGPLLLTIPGFGTVTAAVVVAELGDLRHYRNARQVIKMAGLNLYERSSGYHNGKQRITKRGRSLLRKILYLAVIRQAGPKGIYGDYFRRFPGKPKPKIAVAAMRNLLRLIFAIVRDGRAYGKRAPEDLDTKRQILDAA